MNRQKSNSPEMIQNEETHFQFNWRSRIAILVFFAAICLGIGGLGVFKAWEHSSTGTPVNDGWTWTNAILMNVIFIGALVVLAWESYLLATLKIHAGGITKPLFFGGKTVVRWSELTNIRESKPGVLELTFGKRKITIAPLVYKDPYLVVTAIFSFARVEIPPEIARRLPGPKTKFKYFHFSQSGRSWLNWAMATCLVFSLFFGVLTQIHISSNSFKIVVFIGLILFFLIIGFVCYGLKRMIYCSYLLDQEKISQVEQDWNQSSIYWKDIGRVSYHQDLGTLVLVSQITGQTVLIDGQTDYFEELKQIILDRTGQNLSTAQPSTKKKRPRR